MDPAYMIVTSASGVFNGRPFRNARDITIFDAFASLMVPWKMPKLSTHLIETAFPIQFSLILFNSSFFWLWLNFFICAADTTLTTVNLLSQFSFVFIY